MGDRPSLCSRCLVRPRKPGQGQQLCALCPPVVDRTPSPSKIVAIANQRMVIRWINSPSPLRKREVRWPDNVWEAVRKIATAKGMTVNAYLQSVARIAISEYAYEHPDYEPSKPAEDEDTNHGGSTHD